MSGAQWVRLDVGYLSNPKVRRAGRDGALLHLAAICYLADHELDDGLLPPEAVAVLTPLAYVRHVDAVVERLVKAELWHPSLAGGYLIHDYDALNGAESPAVRARQRQRRKRERDQARLEVDP